MKIINKKIKKVLKSIFLSTYKVSICYRGVFVLAYSIIMYSIFSNHSSAAQIDANGPNVFDKAAELVDNVKGQLIALSAGAAGIGVGTGVFMKKLSMGKQDKIELGNKIIKDSVIGWAILNSITYILSFLAKYTSE